MFKKMFSIFFHLFGTTGDQSERGRPNLILYGKVFVQYTNSILFPKLFSYSMVYYNLSVQQYSVSVADS